MPKLCHFEVKTGPMRPNMEKIFKIFFFKMFHYASWAISTWFWWVKTILKWSKSQKSVFWCAFLCFSYTSLLKYAIFAKNKNKTNKKTCSLPTLAYFFWQKWYFPTFLWHKWTFKSKTKVGPKIFRFYAWMWPKCDIFNMFFNAFCRRNLHLGNYTKCNVSQKSNEGILRKRVTDERTNEIGHIHGSPNYKCLKAEKSWGGGTILVLLLKVLLCHKDVGKYHFCPKKIGQSG